MGQKFRSEEYATEAAGIKGVLAAIELSAHTMVELLQDLEYSTRKGPVAVYLHDEIATAEELERMMRDVKIHELTDEELADR